MMVYFPLIAFSVSNYAKVSPNAGRKGRGLCTLYIPLLNNKETDILLFLSSYRLKQQRLGVSMTRPVLQSQYLSVSMYAVCV